MRARLRLSVGLLVGCSTVGVAMADEGSAPAPGDKPRDVHISLNVSDSVTSDGGSISAEGGKVLVKVKGTADARVARDGALSIDGKPIAVSGDGRQALMAYYANGQSLVEQGKAMGKEGVFFAFNTIGNVFASLLTESEDEASRRVEKDATRLQERAMALCATLDDLRQAQESVAAAVPEFAPYASVVTAKSVDDCNENARNSIRHGRV